MIGFGTKTNTSKEIIQMAITNGYFFIDTKDSNENIRFFKDLNYDREKIFFCSKLMGETSPVNHKPENVYKECITPFNISNASFKSDNSVFSKNLNVYNVIYYCK